jgi:hypothetical protein
MGLTISYTLSTRRKLSETILLQFVERTAEFARKIGCEQVFGPQMGGPAHWKLWKLPDGSTTGEQISALEGWSVSVLPGEGCENADFGLCRYPGVKGWKLTSWCKTQYAARHGIEHFLACHRRVISLLDLWREFGVNLDVCDEGEYWETRSLDHLRKRVGTYDRLVAAVAGTMKDSAEGEPGFTAEIFDDARFEHLEAEGRQEFGDHFEQMKRAFPPLK